MENDAKEDGSTLVGVEHAPFRRGGRALTCLQDHVESVWLSGSLGQRDDVRSRLMGCFSKIQPDENVCGDENQDPN